MRFDPVLPRDRIRTLPKGTALLLATGVRPALIRLRPWYKEADAGVGTQHFRRLERNGILERRVVSTRPVAVEYAVPPLGHTLREPVSTPYRWAREHSTQARAARDAAELVREGGADASGGLGLDQLLEHARSHGPDKLDTLGRT
ncbi:winged helix-turn-helix transcriptional regulator [Streptomyces sp. NPDC050619]|uniref:winged helix-turn-helix transcriptional regulator n=1 Tax=Streptomyces sp. NPDC050619 TaxID=3157214 RepID=UPI00342D1CB5